MKRLLIMARLAIVGLIWAQLGYAQQLAFPGAEGFGKYTTGGRGGSVYHVTNLNDSGSGSFRDAVSQSNRIVVFDVGGVINITTRIVIHSNITVAGQTAPGGGITIYGNGIALNDDSGNDIIRYIRIRMGKNGDSGKDAVGISAGQDYIFDHVSISWGRDGTLDVNGTGIDNLTFQDCIVSQGINNLNHSTGGLMQSGKWSIIRSLYIDNKTRNPKARGTQEFINSVLYNWGTNGYIMGDTEGLSECNLIGNYFIYGPSSSSGTHITNTTSAFHVYPSDNWVDSDKDGVLDGSLLTNYSTATVMSSPYNYPGVDNLMSAQNALNHVIQNVGASIVRDAVDNLLINQLTSYGTQGAIILTEDDNGIANNVGTVANGTPATDTDGDGMPDSWESANGTNPYSADHNGDVDGDGYTNIEEYFDWIVNGNSSSCTPTTIIPYVQIDDGSWSQSSTATVDEGGTVKFGPQPSTGGSWSWSGPNNYSASIREITISNITTSQAGNYIATYTNSGGCQSTQTFVITVNTSTTSTVTIEENTTGFCSVDGTVDNNNAGYTGTGFANTTNATGTGIDWKITFNSSGTQTFTFRYASTSDRPGNLIVNGSTVASNISFPSTGSWTTWSTVSTSAYISAGTYDVRLEATSSSGLGNIDNITVTNASAASCSSTTVTYTLSTSISGSGTVNPSNGTYESGTVVSVSATPSSGYTFSGWSGDASGTTNPLSITMNSNKSITATFTQTTSPATLVKHGEGSSSQTITLGESIVSFYYSWTNATTVSVSGMPSGITTAIDNSAQTVTFSGTPTEIGTFNYTVTTVGGSTNVSASGTITVNGNNITLTIQENETGFCSVDGTVDNNNSGFTGTGFANTTNSSEQGISWTVNIPSSGSYTLGWRFANGGTTDRPGALMVDGSTIISSISFPSTDSWTTWTTTSGNSVSLSAGDRVIRLQATGSSGLANIDYITVYGINPTPVSCTGVRSSNLIYENNIVADFIAYTDNINSDYLNLNYYLNNETVVKVSIYNIQGTIIQSENLGYFEKGEFNYSIKLKNDQTGIYFIKANFSNEIKTAKFIKY